MDEAAKANQDQCGLSKKTTRKTRELEQLRCSLEIQSDPIYVQPSEKEGEEAKSRKQGRREHRVAMDESAKANQDQCGLSKKTTAMKVERKKPCCTKDDAEGEGETKRFSDW
ncbi:hypothetical protein PHMEG_00031822 [Phytophthora megakarya]|uniref:Uncharacterized protein n=1 Tax=Phytophthora megakarya TaxID=4795 RepID=A0A225UXR9_9STRA|nr:hypothetical protein PHMEG_00031822 [Phytophthora megakarya]